MGKMLKQDSPYEQKLQQIETLMDKLGVQITVYGSGMTVSFGKDKRDYWIEDTESGERTLSFPRMFDTERLILWE